MLNEEKLLLNNGIEIPRIGYGTYLTSPRKTESLVRQALDLGYRHIDTAQNYGNEREVGQALKNSSLNREDVFITSKTQTIGYDSTIRGIKQSLKALNTDYIDLMIIHWPNSDNEGTYRALEEAYKNGLLKSIGLSNFNQNQVKHILDRFETKPVVDQIETHVLWQQKKMHDFLATNGIIHESWSPFGEGMDNIFQNRILNQIGEAHGKSAAQIILRFLVQNYILVIPKSTNAKRMKENLEIFDFNLSDSELKTIRMMDKKKSYSGWPSSMQEN